MRTALADRKPLTDTAGTRLILWPGDRHQAIVDLIRSARRHLILSLFRFSDFRIVEEISRAVGRKVHVEVLITNRAKGWKKRLKQLECALIDVGADVCRYPRGHRKYHAKYMVADGHTALIGSLNCTPKCFSRTCDFLVATQDNGVIFGLRQLFRADRFGSQTPLAKDLCDRLIIGPDRARDSIRTLLQEARHRICIIDHKLTDPEMVRLLAKKRSEGVRVELLDGPTVGEWVSHGRMILVDEAESVIGGISLSPAGLDVRRELALRTSEPDLTRQLTDFFDRQARSLSKPASRCMGQGTLGLPLGQAPLPYGLG